MICFMCSFSPQQGYCYCSRTRLISIASTTNLPILLNTVLSTVPSDGRMHRRVKSEPCLHMNTPLSPFNRRVHSLRIGRKRENREGEKTKKINPPIKISIVSIGSSGDHFVPYSHVCLTRERKEHRHLDNEENKENLPSSSASSSDVLSNHERGEEEYIQLENEEEGSSGNYPIDIPLGESFNQYSAIEGMERLSLDTDPPPADIENGMEKNVSYGKEMDEFVNSWNGLDPQRDPFEMDRLSRISDWVERSEAGVIDSDRDTDIDFFEDVRRASAIYEEGEIRTDEERTEIQRDGRRESEVHTDNMDILHLDDHLEGGSFVLSQLPSSYPNTVPRHLIGSSEEEGLEECDAIGSSNIPLRPLIYSSPHRPTSSHGRRLSQPLLDSLDRLLGTNAPVFTSEEVAFSSDLSHTITHIDQYSRRPTLIDMSPLASIEAKENSGKTLRNNDIHSEAMVPSSDVEEGSSEVERDSKVFEVISGIVGDHKVITNVIKKKEEVITMNLINLESDGEILMSPPKYSELKTPDPHDNLASLLNYVEREEGRDDERKEEREEERDDDRFRDPFDVDIDWKRDIEGGGEMQRSYHLHTQTKKNRSVPLAILMQRITSSDSEGEGQRSRERNREVRGKRKEEKEETEEEEDVLDMYRNMVVSVERDGVIEQGEEEELIRSIKRTSGLWETEITSLFPANVWVDKVEEVEVVVTECSSKSRRSELSEDFIPEERNSEHIERREEHRENRENERENEGSDTMIILEPSREMEETSLDTKPSMTSYWIEENEEREEREGGLEKKRDPAIDHLIHSREQSDMSGNTYIINRSIDTTGRESGDSRQTYDIDYVLEESEHREYREAENAQCEILFPIGHQMKTEFDTVPSTGRSSEDESERTTESGESRQPEYTDYTGETLQKTSTTVEDSETTEENEESDYDNVLESIRENEEHQLERENSEENEDGAVEKESERKYEGERRVDSTSDTEKEKKEGIKEEESEETVDTREEDVEGTKEEEEKTKESSDTSDSEEQMEEVADDEGWESDKESEIGEIIVLEERVEDTSGGERRAEEERPDDERSSEESGVEKTPDYEKGNSVELEENNREENREVEDIEEKEEEEREMDETPADSQVYPLLLTEKGEKGEEYVQITINDDNLIDSEKKNPESGRGQKEGGVPTRKGSTALSIGRSDTLQSDNSVATFVSSDMDRASIVKLNYHSNVDKAAWKGDVREVNLDEVERFWDYRYTKEQDSMREVEKEEKEREEKETECERLLAERVRRYYGMKTPLPETPDMDRRNQQENSVPLTPLPLLDVPSSPNIFQLPSSPPIQITLEVPPDPSKEETEGESSISIGHMSTDSENEEGQKTLSERFFRLTKLDIDTDSEDVGRVERTEAVVSSSGSRRNRKLRNSPHPFHPRAYSSSSSQKGRGLSSSTLYKRRVPRHTTQQTNNIQEKNMEIPDIHFDLNSPRLSDTDESLISDEERRILMNESPSGRKSVTFSEKLADYPSPRPFIRTDSALLKIRCSKGILKKEDKQRESIRRILEYAGERLHKDLCLLVEERDRTVSALELTPLDNFGLSPQTSHYQTRYRDQLSQNKGALDARIDTVWRKLKEAAVDMNKCAWIYSVTDSSQLTLKVKRRVLPRRSTTFFNVERRNKSDIELASEYAQKLAKMRGEMMRKDSEDTVDEGYLGLLKRVSRTLGSSDNIARM